MTINANIYEVAIILICIAFLIFVIALIPMLLQLKRTIRAVEELTVESKKTVESLNHVIKITVDQAGDLEELVKKVKEVGMKFMMLGELFADGVKNPIITLISLLFGIEHAFKRFFRRRERKGGGGDATQ